MNWLALASVASTGRAQRVSDDDQALLGIRVLFEVGDGA
jgi:hypothetical protein